MTWSTAFGVFYFIFSWKHFSTLGKDISFPVPNAGHAWSWTPRNPWMPDFKPCSLKAEQIICSAVFQEKHMHSTKTRTLYHGQGSTKSSLTIWPSGDLTVFPLIMYTTMLLAHHKLTYLFWNSSNYICS